MFLPTLVLSWQVGQAAEGRVFSATDVPPAEVAVVFGAAVYQDGRLSNELADRMLTAVDLYRAGKVRKLLLSGDNRRRGYDEPTAMARFAAERGVPRADLVLDYAGFHTYDTCYRAHHIFQLSRAILVTQEFHLARALFIANHLGLSATGVKADRQRYQRAPVYAVREQVSRARAWVQINLTRPRPHFLGPRVEIL